MELKCCVVGAGINGLIAARHIREVMQVTVFECRDEVGGQWYFSPETDSETPDSDLFKQLYGHTQSSMYEELFLHNPAEVTQTEDFPRRYSKSYCHRSEVHQYLRDYTDHFDLRRLIKFNTAVTLIKPLSQEEFEVTYKDQSGLQVTEVFNRIAIANGHFSVPYIPEIPGAHTFPGSLLHSHNLKKFNPAFYENKTVIVSGAYASAWDVIKFLLARTNAKVVISATEHGLGFYNSISDPDFLRYLEPTSEGGEGARVVLKLPIKEIAGTQVTMGDGSSITTDAIILCTGFKFSYPFLPHQEVSEHWQYVNHLYKGIIDVKFPRIAHVGLHRGLTFIRAELTGKLLKKLWLLEPDTEGMRQELEADEEDMRSKGLALYRYYTVKFNNPNDVVELFSKFGVTYDEKRFEEVLEYGIRNFIDILTKFLSFKDEDLS